VCAVALQFGYPGYVQSVFDRHPTHCPLLVSHAGVPNCGEQFMLEVHCTQ